MTITLKDFQELEAKYKSLEASMGDNLAEKETLLAKVNDLEAKMAVVTEVTVESPEFVALKAENAELKTKISELETSSTELVELKAKFDSQVKEQAEIKASEIIASAHVSPVKVAAEPEKEDVLKRLASITSPAEQRKFWDENRQAIQNAMANKI